MGIFTRFRDIVASNINAILDRAENPEKIVRMMILEMEDTLVEVKSNCARVIADQKRLERMQEEAQELAHEWEARAELAVEKGRDDLARAALAEKRKFASRGESMNLELETAKQTVAIFQSEIVQLEAKLADAREKQRAIIQRHATATTRRQSQQHIRRIDTSEAFMKFEAFENGIDRLEAEAELTDSLRPRDTLRDEFATLAHSEEIEQELQELKKKRQGD
jgi:phage shock protein A